MSNLFSRATISVTGTIGNVELVDVGEKKLLKFSLVTVDRYKEKGDWQEAIIWHNISIWNPFPFYVDNIVKGAKGVTVDGRLVGRNYTSKEGVDKVFQQVEANNGSVIFSNYSKDSTKNTTDNTGAPSSTGDDDLPF